MEKGDLEAATMSTSSLGEGGLLGKAQCRKVRDSLERQVKQTGSLSTNSRGYENIELGNRTGENISHLAARVLRARQHNLLVERGRGLAAEKITRQK